jgi:hypothetical protein
MPITKAAGHGYYWIWIYIARCKRIVAVRIHPGLILIVLGAHWVSAFGEEIPAGQPPAPENVMPAKGGRLRQ